MKKYILTVEALSPVHLGAGKSDVIIDAETAHDEFGMPYFPAKRLKGLLRFFREIDKDIVPQNSILREFIGGSIFYKY